MEAEFRYLNKPTGPRNIQDISHWLVSWENRVQMLKSMSPHHIISDQSRKNILYDAVPQKLRDIINAEVAKGELTHWASFKEFVVNYSDSEAANASNSKPAPLSANAVQEPPGNSAPEETEYTDEQWYSFLSNHDGQIFALSNPDHPQVKAYVMSVVMKGKGKGKDWNKGSYQKGYQKGKEGYKGKGGKDDKGKGDKGKGEGKGFQGYCYSCGQFGHSARNCPNSGAAGNVNLTQDQDAAAHQNNWWSMTFLCTEKPSMLNNSVGHITETQPDNKIPFAMSHSKTPNAQIVNNNVVLIGSNFFKIEDGIKPDVQSPVVFPTVAQATTKKPKAKKPKTVPPNHEEILQLSECIMSNRKPKQHKKKQTVNEDTNKKAHVYTPSGPDCPCMGCKIGLDGQRAGKCIFSGEVSTAPLPADRPDAERLKHVQAAIDAIQTRTNAESKCQTGCACNKIAWPTPTTAPTEHGDDILCGLCTTDPDDNLLTDEPKKIPDGGLTYPDMTDFLGISAGNSVLVIGDKPMGGSAILSTEEMVWAKVAIASDSGCVRHATPKNTLGTQIQPATRSQAGHKYCGANNSPIDNHGGQKVSGETNEGVNLTMDFDVADVSRPLLSIAEIISKKRHRVVYDDPVSYIEDKVTGRRVDLRYEDGLFFLDVWMNIPRSIAGNPFVRQVA